LRAPRLLAAACAAAPAAPLQLLPCPRGSLGSLRAQPHGSQGLGAGDTWVSVRSVGLNFRDVLNVLGMYPGDPGAPGGDFAGVVLQSLAGLRAGACVFGLAPGCLGTHALTSARIAAPKPGSLPFEQAAAAPTIFVTVSLALSRAGALRGGGGVLVHAASGGVGMAAVELVRAARGSLVATAGSARKRALLRALDAGRCASSRDLRFAESAALASRGGGVACVLNSLTSAGFVAASLAALAAGGRLAEIAKRDVWSAARLRQERGDASYSLVALTFCRPLHCRPACGSCRRPWRAAQCGPSAH